MFFLKINRFQFFWPNILIVMPEHPLKLIVAGMLDTKEWLDIDDMDDVDDDSLVQHFLDKGGKQIGCGLSTPLVHELRMLEVSTC